MDISQNWPYLTFLDLVNPDRKGVDVQSKADELEVLWTSPITVMRL